ncbi:MerR family transcriptional regulator [Lentzea sp. BCCO 10_0798]|uniref:MerR family transcriptional regulator n=1 Tax=Lentzea kristufekii TaxID=3095430 RepID=A0ABU4TQM7_9PSEU|nr:MerR family transcriptional regulator [Lentzea sp. BCCO 10_0798]MDX8050520.1 MerR family transcriptional regulator [Lentzea sp. BCCO 10_0798]
MWTLDELLDRVSAALTAEYSGAPNGRVRDVPDKRAVRWYATTGLVDRPSAMRGRTALYEKRHLLQLVAVKRLQSQGRTLAEVQAELAGATDTTLAAIARVPEHLLSTAEAPPEAVRPRFWAEPAAAPAAPPAPAEAFALNGVALGGGAVVLVPGTPTAADRADIAAAARPLLDLLAARGLLNERESS